MIGNVFLLIVVVWLVVRLFGESFVEMGKGMIAAVRSGNLTLISQFLVNVLLAVVSLLVVQSTWQRLLPVEGVTYVSIPFLERAAEWVTDLLNSLLSSP